MATQIMTEKERKSKLSNALRRYRIGARQAATALGSRHKSIAVKVLDQIDMIRGQIDEMIAGGNYSPFVSCEIKKLQKQQRSNAEGFAAAIKLGKIKEARIVLGHLISTDTELTDLLGIEPA